MNILPRACARGKGMASLEKHDSGLIWTFRHLASCNSNKTIKNGKKEKKPAGLVQELNSGGHESYNSCFCVCPAYQPTTSAVSRKLIVEVSCESVTSMTSRCAQTELQSLLPQPFGEVQLPRGKRLDTVNS